jgi:DNA modification methylase
MGRDEGEKYDDEPDVFWSLLDGLCEALPRLLSSSGHLMFWLDSKPETIQRALARFAELAPELTFVRFPLIWLKSDNAGIAAVPSQEPRHIYETALLGSTGQRPIVRIKSDAYSCPTDKSLHPSCKPEAMLRHFFEMIVDETSSVFDPTCGSGTALRAAESLGATRVLGLERDEGFAKGALGALEASRGKRKAAEALGL